MIRILVKEDNAFLLGVIRDTLELDGYSVCGVTNGVQAIEAFSRFRPELIVTDLTMPDMDGLQLYRQVQQESSGAAIPFVFIDGRDMAQTVRRVAKNSGMYFLRKPFSPEELLRAVRELLG